MKGSKGEAVDGKAEVGREVILSRDKKGEVTKTKDVRKKNRSLFL